MKSEKERRPIAGEMSSSRTARFKLFISIAVVGVVGFGVGYAISWNSQRGAILKITNSSETSIQQLRIRYGNREMLLGNLRKDESIIVPILAIEFSEAIGEQTMDEVYELNFNWMRNENKTFRASFYPSLNKRYLKEPPLNLWIHDEGLRYSDTKK